ncbi:MAG: NO-inducible flavohemoprotein [Thiomicrorhabdus sp.]|nr:NO-inducible flavohemoprotein [Thiomicrorhabdus sp.]
MISEKTLEIVKSTAPVLAKEGEAITKLFYQKLFASHPELKNIFNMANQSTGEQSRALADSIFQYAVHIDKLELLGDAVSRIAHKHASLQVAPEHYPVVGRFLLEAIQEHLSLESDDPIMAAWKEAYGALAAIFVNTEEAIYQANEEKLGGWRGDREFVISEIKEEGGGIKSFYLNAKDGKPIASFEPGQYVGVKVLPDNSEFTAIRQYSLSNAPNHHRYRITVRAETHTGNPDGVVSHFLQNLSVGDVLLLQPPTGDFVIKHPKDDLVFIAGGVGITPLISMLLAKIEQQEDVSKVTFIQCCRDQSHHIFATELKALQAKHGFRYLVSYEQGSGADVEGVLTKDILDQWLPNKQTNAYFCGPKPFMAAINQTLQGIGFKEAQLHYEVFGPTLALSES